MRDAAFVPYVQLVCLFAAGTWHDYKHASPGTLPPMNEAQERQLQRLTLVSLAQEASPYLSFEDMGRAVDMPVHDDGYAIPLLSLLIESLELGMITGRIDEIGRRLCVVTCTSRDVLPPDAAPASQSTLTRLATDLHAWKEKTRVVLVDLDSKIDALCKQTEASAEAHRRHHTALLEALRLARHQMQQRSHSPAGAVASSFAGDADVVSSSNRGQTSQLLRRGKRTRA